MTSTTRGADGFVGGARASGDVGGLWGSSAAWRRGSAVGDAWLASAVMRPLAMTYSDSTRLRRPLAETSSNPWPRGRPPATTSLDTVAWGESFGDDLLRFVFMPFMIMFYIYYYTIYSFHWGFYDDEYDVSHVAWFFTVTTWIRACLLFVTRMSHVTSHWLL